MKVQAETPIAFLKPLEHFTGEIHWFPSRSEGLRIPCELEEMLQKHTYRYGWSTSVVELKDTGNYAASKSYEPLATFVESEMKKSGSPVLKDKADQLISELSSPDRSYCRKQAELFASGNSEDKQDDALWRIASNVIEPWELSQTLTSYQRGLCVTIARNLLD